MFDKNFPYVPLAIIAALLVGVDTAMSMMMTTAVVTATAITANNTNNMNNMNNIMAIMLAAAGNPSRGMEGAESGI